MKVLCAKDVTTRILHVPGYEFENLDDETANLSEAPPFLFKPMPLSDLLKKNILLILP